MKINQAGLDLIKSFEGCKLDAYEDIVGVVTIGYGHTGDDIELGDTIAEDEAEELLKEDLERFENGVDGLLTCEATENQFSALVCFSYNVGLNALKGSTLLRKLNAGDVQGAAQDFVRWAKAGGKEVPGLLRRREAEQKLFSGE